MNGYECQYGSGIGIDEGPGSNANERGDRT
jgi:hypothetical protein